MTEEKSGEVILNQDEFIKETGLSIRALRKYEKAGYVKPVHRSGNQKGFTQEDVEIAKAMMLYQSGRSSNLNEAYEMAVRAASGKLMRRDESSESTSHDLAEKGIMDPKQIKTHPAFENLLPIDPKTREDIARSMALHGYYESQAITLGIWEGQDEAVCIDGHTRREAAIEQGIDVHYVIRSFADEMEALEHAMSLQKDRRVTEDRHIFQFIERYDSLMERGGDRKSEEAKSKPTNVGIEGGRSASAHRTATMVGCNYKKVERARKVLKDGTATLIDEVKSGKKKISKAYNEILGKKKSEDEETAEEKSSNEQSKPVNDILTKKNLSALKKLDGKLEDHLNAAVEQYIINLREDA